MPVYGLGTWGMGGGMTPDNSNDEADLAGINAALDMGVTHIDTAEMYGAGHSEELVGQAIKDRERSQLFITTKVSRGMAGGYDGVLGSAKASLQHLSTGYIDLYLLHSYPSTPIKDIMMAMDYLVDSGLVKNIGVCNLTLGHFEEAQSSARNKLVCNQVHYSVKMREPELEGLTKQALDKDYFITAWGPLEKGLLEGDMLRQLAAKYDKTPYQIALNWIMAQPNVITIPKTTSVEHLQENLGALGWEMDPSDLELLSKDFPNQQPVSHRVPLG
jgi:diketogulonate reductase-like aldo/keto reductase